MIEKIEIMNFLTLSTSLARELKCPLSLIAQKAKKAKAKKTIPCLSS